MEKNLEGWKRIAELIALDKQAALAEFGRRPFLHVEPAGAQPGPLRGRRPFLLIAASLLLAAGLVSLWLLMGSWRSSSSAPALAALLSDSYFYSRAGSAEASAPATVPPPAVNPCFAAWVEAGLGRATAAAETVDPLAPIEQGDPAEVRQKLGRVIRESTLERLLTQFHEIHNQEA